MKKHRKDDQYYIDNYDRSTIAELKQIEAESIEKGIQLKRPETSSDFIINENPYNPLTFFFERAATLASIKKDVITSQKLDDEQRDRLIEQHSTPEVVKCNTCNSRMSCSNHLFKENNTLLIFVFKCPKGHVPHKLLYPNGDEFFLPKTKCRKCGGELELLTEEKERSTVFTDKCKSCGDIRVLELDFTPDEPIDEADRKKYCTDFINEKTFLDSLLDIEHLEIAMRTDQEEQEEKLAYNVEQIQQLTIPQVEQRLAKLTKKLGYIKFQFEKPDMGRHVVVEFSLQDPTERNEKESKKILLKKIPEDLFTTSWRLQKQSVSYRLGYITGKLKAYTDDEGLIKIAKEIKGSG